MGDWGGYGPGEVLERTLALERVLWKQRSVVLVQGQPEPPGGTRNEESIGSQYTDAAVTLAAPS